MGGKVEAVTDLLGKRVVVSVGGSSLPRITGVLTEGTYAENGKPCLSLYALESDYEVVIGLPENVPGR
jgi:hypothetical protein